MTLLPGDDDDEIERKIKKKDKKLGNIKFSALLVKENLVAKKVVLMMLGLQLDQNTDLSLECVKITMDILLDTLYEAGRESDAIKMSLVEIFSKIKDAGESTTSKVKARTKFMLKDILEKYSALRSSSK